MWFCPLPGPCLRLMRSRIRASAHQISLWRTSLALLPMKLRSHRLGRLCVGRRRRTVYLRSGSRSEAKRRQCAQEKREGQRHHSHRAPLLAKPRRDGNCSWADAVELDTSAPPANAARTWSAAAPCLAYRLPPSLAHRPRSARREKSAILWPSQPVPEARSRQSSTVRTTFDVKVVSRASKVTK